MSELSIRVVSKLIFLLSLLSANMCFHAVKPHVQEHSRHSRNKEGACTNVFRYNSIEIYLLEIRNFKLKNDRDECMDKLAESIKCHMSLVPLLENSENFPRNFKNSLRLPPKFHRSFYWIFNEISASSHWNFAVNKKQNGLAQAVMGINTWDSKMSSLLSVVKEISVLPHETQR